MTLVEIENGGAFERAKNEKGKKVEPDIGKKFISIFESEVGCFSMSFRLDGVSFKNFKK